MTENNDKVKQLIYAVKYVQALRGGTAHVIEYSDGKRYVTKFYGVKKGRIKEVVNEYVIAKLAQLLSLPIIPFTLVYVPEEFIKNTPELQQRKRNYNPGTHYGCVYIENCMPFEDVRETLPSKGEVKNRNMLAGITVFDQWVNNSDRGTMNVILERLSDGSYYVHMIDHGRCFPGRYEWNAQTLREGQPEYNFKWPFYQWANSLLDDSSELTSLIDKIEKLPNESIYEVIHSIPAEWNVSLKEREALYQFLLNQKKALPNIVSKIIKYYSTKK